MVKKYACRRMMDIGPGPQASACTHRMFSRLCPHGGKDCQPTLDGAPRLQITHAPCQTVVLLPCSRHEGTRGVSKQPQYPWSWGTYSHIQSSGGGPTTG
jgi:hypothetical protein